MAGTRPPAPLLLRPLALGVAVAFGSCGGSAKVQPKKKTVHLAPGEVAPSPNGIEFPHKYKNWPVLSMTQRPDKGTISVVVGNLEAVRAVRKGKTDPWPNGSIIGHLVFGLKSGRETAYAVTSGDFLRAEFMFKDIQAYAGNGSGWGFARWDGDLLSPYGDDEDVGQECIRCHKKVSGNDWLFMKAIDLP